AVDGIERRGVVGGYVVKLGDRQVGDKLPVGGTVEALVNAAVAADQIVTGIVRVDPNLMIIDVFEPFAERPQRLAAVVGNANQHVHYVNPVAVFRIDDEVSVVLSLMVELVAPVP